MARGTDGEGKAAPSSWNYLGLSLILYFSSNLVRALHGHKGSGTTQRHTPESLGNIEGVVKNDRVWRSR